MTMTKTPNNDKADFSPVFDGGCEPEVWEAELAAEATLGVVVEQLGVAAGAAVQLEDRRGQLQEPPHLNQLPL